MPVLFEPLPHAEARLLRTAVLTVAQSERRRRIAPQLRIGVPGGPLSSVADQPDWDHGLRSEIVGAMLRDLRDPGWVWVTRSGPLTLQDVDAAWLGPTVTAAAERDVDVAFVVVTRHGWVDPRSGVRREWKRIRSR